MKNEGYEAFQRRKSGADDVLPPEELVDPTPDHNDIPSEILDTAQEAKHDVSDD